MDVRIGPVDPASALAWIANARAVLAGVRRAGDRVPITLPPDVEEAFEGYLERWEAHAHDGTPFDWRDEVDEGHARHLTVWFFSLLTLDDRTWEALGLPFAPPESEPFYEALSAAVTEALAASDREVGATLKASWPETPSIPERPASGVARRVVIVDDTSDVRTLFSVRLLLDGRFEVVGEAADGAAGLELCRAQQPDAVLLDNMMPVMDGLTALPHIRAACPSARIVILTAAIDPRAEERALATGADAYLSKGEAIDVVLDALAGAPA